MMFAAFPSITPVRTGKQFHNRIRQPTVVPKSVQIGSTLAWRSQRVVGSEADRWLITTLAIDASGKPLNKPVEHPLVDDISVGEFVWADNRSIVFSAEWQARHRIYELHLDNPGKRESVIADNVGGVSDLIPLADDAMLYIQSTLQYPNEIFVRDKAGREKNLSNANTALRKELAMAEPNGTWTWLWKTVAKCRCGF